MYEDEDRDDEILPVASNTQIRNAGRLLRNLTKVNQQVKEMVQESFKAYYEGDCRVRIPATHSEEQNLELVFMGDSNTNTGCLRLTCENSGDYIDISISQLQEFHRLSGIILGKKK